MFGRLDLAFCPLELRLVRFIEDGLPFCTLFSICNSLLSIGYLLFCRVNSGFVSVRNSFATVRLGIWIKCHDLFPTQAAMLFAHSLCSAV